MHTIVQPREPRQGGAAGDSADHSAEQAKPGRPAVAARVGVAGATGYTGQELLRLLARHPSVTITAATSSGATPAGGPRRLPALSRIWNGTIAPLDSAALAREADVVFLALPDKAAAELAPALTDAG